MSDDGWRAPWADEREKFDIQLAQGTIAERQLAAVFTTGKIEVKSESYWWERTGNIAIEYWSNGKPSCIAVTEAEVWAHQLKSKDGAVLVTLLFPIERLKQLAREAIRDDRVKLQGGDGGRQKFALVRLIDIFKTDDDERRRKTTPIVTRETGAP